MSVDEFQNDFSRSQDTCGIKMLISILSLHTEMTVPSTGGKGREEWRASLQNNNTGSSPYTLSAQNQDQIEFWRCS